MISKGNPDPEVIRQVLNIGLQHHTSAIEQMQDMISQPKESNAEALLANSALLVPFAVAFQHINYWVLFMNGSHESSLSVTPRDAVALMRGLKSTVGVLSSKKAGNSAEGRSSPSSSPWDTIFSSPTSGHSNSAAVSRTHLMFPILAATSQ
jgi:hypothetical protein